MAFDTIGSTCAQAEDGAVDMSVLGREGCTG